MDAVFHSEGNSSLTLSIERYEFPESTEYNSANWLMMKIVSESNGDKLVRFDPSFQRWEYAALAQWLRVIEDEHAPSKLITIDNEFLFYKVVANRELMLKILGSYKGSNLFPFRLNNFQAIADAIESQLEEYPERYST